MKKIIFLFIATAFITIGCNQSDKKNTSSHKAQKETKQEVVNLENIGTKLVINSNDQMLYDKKILRAKAGSKIALTLNHTGKAPKSVMGHNWVLLKKGVDVDEFAKKAIKAVDNDYIPEGDEVIVHTKVLGGGESTTIVFDAPKKGSYQYLCSFPAHYAMMKRRLYIE